MAIPDQFLDDLSARTDIVDVVSQYVSLNKKGGTYWGLCPFHHEKTPSFAVSAERQMFHCFGCNKGGGVYRFLMEMENLSFPEAVQKLAERAGMEVPEEQSGAHEWRKKREHILELNKEAARFYRNNLKTPAGAAVLQYIQKRAISPKFSARFGLGAAPDAWDALRNAMLDQGYEKQDLLDAGLAVAGKNGGIYDKFRNRLMLPVIDVRGSVIGFTSRVMDQSEPKYLNTPETAIFKKRQILYGLNYAKSTRRDNLILVEGNMDVITLQQAGFDNAVATMGTALTEDHIKIFEKYTKELVLCYDNDNAGVEATQRALTLLKNSNLNVKVLQLPRRETPEGELVKQDADDFIKNHGPEAFEALMNRSEGGIEYQMGVVRKKYDLDEDEQRTAYLHEAARLVAALPSPMDREIYAGRAAREADISRETVLREVEDLRKKHARAQRKAQERKDLAPAQQLQPKERELRYRDIRLARAAEGILRIVLMDADYFSQLEDISGDQFDAPLLGKTFELLRNRWREDKPVTLAALDGVLSPAESDHLANMMQEPQSRATARESLEDFKAIVREGPEKRVEDVAELLTMRERLKEKKINGGNDHE